MRHSAAPKGRVASFSNSITISCKSVMVSSWYACANQSKRVAKEWVASRFRKIGHHLFRTTTQIVMVVIVIIIIMQSTYLSICQRSSASVFVLSVPGPQLMDHRPHYDLIRLPRDRFHDGPRPPISITLVPLPRLLEEAIRIYCIFPLDTISPTQAFACRLEFV
jgi:hypothetical protein